MTEDLTYSYDHVHASLCIIEEIVSPAVPEMPQPWTPFRDNNGINELRDLVITKLTAPCNEAWHRAYSRYEEAVRYAPTREEANRIPDPGSFDYDFVPIWLRHCVDWSDPTNPRVRGDAGRDTVVSLAIA